MPVSIAIHGNVHNFSRNFILSWSWDPMHSHIRPFAWAEPKAWPPVLVNDCVNTRARLASSLLNCVILTLFLAAHGKLITTLHQKLVLVERVVLAWARHVMADWIEHGNRAFVNRNGYALFDSRKVVLGTWVVQQRFRDTLRTFRCTKAISSCRFMSLWFVLPRSSLVFHHTIEVSSHSCLLSAQRKASIPLHYFIFVRGVLSNAWFQGCLLKVGIVIAQLGHRLWLTFAPYEWPCLVLVGTGNAIVRVAGS